MKHSKVFLSASSVAFAFLLTILLSSNVFAAYDVFITIKGTHGEGTYTGKVDANGDCVIPNVKPGTYKAVLESTIDWLAASGVTKDSKTIEISSFSWGMSNPGSMAAGGSAGRGSGKANFSDISIMKKNDQSSTGLAVSSSSPSGSSSTSSSTVSSETAVSTSVTPAAGGFTSKTCMLSLRKSGSVVHQDFYQINMGDVTVSNITENGDPHESVQRSASPTGYDLKMNVKI